MPDKKPAKKPTAKERADSRWHGQPLSMPDISKLSTKAEKANALSKLVAAIRIRASEQPAPDGRLPSKLDRLANRLKAVDTPKSTKAKRPKR